MIKIKACVRNRILQDMVIMFAVVMLIIAAVCVPQIRTEFSAEMFETDRITIYTDGYYGRTMEEPLELRGADEVDGIIQEAMELDQYKPVEREEERGERNAVWVDFHTGYQIGMCLQLNSGNVGEEMMETGPGQEYQLPSGLREAVIEALEENRDY